MCLTLEVHILILESVKSILFPHLSVAHWLTLTSLKIHSDCHQKSGEGVCKISPPYTTKQASHSVRSGASGFRSRLRKIISRTSRLQGALIPSYELNTDLNWRELHEADCTTLQSLPPVRRVAYNEQISNGFMWSPCPSELQ